MKKFAAFAAFVALSLGVHAEIQLTGFGTGDFTDGGTSSSFVQTATATTFSGSDQVGSFGGTFTSVNITGNASQVSLTGTLATANSSSFVLQLWDGGENFFDYAGNWSSFTVNESSTVVLTAIAPEVGPFNFTTVQGMQILFGGTGSTLTFTFDNLTAGDVIPEPTTYAALFGAAGLTFAACRRRRR